MSLLPTHQRVCEHSPIVWWQRRKWLGIKSGNEEEFDSEEDDSDNEFVFNNLDEKSNPSP